MRRFFVAATWLCLAAPAFGQTYGNCGQTWAVAQPPQRIVALNQHSADTLLSLGAGDLLAGVAYIDDDGAAIEHGAYRAIPALSRLYPSAEVLYSQHADLVVGGFASAFDNNLTSRATLGANGIASYLMESACDGRSLDFFGHIRNDLRTLGALVRQPERAKQLIARLDADLAGARALHDESRVLSVFYLDSEVNGLHSVGTRGFITALLAAAGGRNSFADVDIPRLNVSNEVLLMNDPDVILLADAVWSPASRKRHLLQTDPLLSRLRAVRENRLIDIPFAHLVPTPASGAVALDLAKRFKAMAGKR